MWKILCYFLPCHSMRKEAILILHFFLICYMCLYAFVCKRTRWDYFYLLFVYCIVFQRTFYNGECSLSYYYKKTDDPDYVAGTDFKTDYEIAFGQYSWVGAYIYLRNIAFGLSVFLVSRRNSIPFFLYGSFFALFGLSIASTLFYRDGFEPTFVQSQKVLQLLFMGLGVAAAMYAVTYKEKVEINPFKEIAQSIEPIQDPDVVSV